MTDTALTLWMIEGTYLKPIEEIAALTPQHREWLDQNFRSGVFITSGRKLDNKGGVLLAQAESEEQLRELFKNDPFIREGYAEYRYVPFTPVKRSRVLDLAGVPLIE